MDDRFYRRSRIFVLGVGILDSGFEFLYFLFSSSEKKYPLKYVYIEDDMFSYNVRDRMHQYQVVPSTRVGVLCRLRHWK